MPHDNDNRLAEIQARAALAIPGPWRWLGNAATHQIYLATPDRGMLYLLGTRIGSEAYVFDHQSGEGYAIEEARRRVHELWCPLHRENGDPEGECLCDEIRDFLRDELTTDEGARHYTPGPLTSRRDSRPLDLTMYLHVWAELDLPDDSLGVRRPQAGGMLRSFVHYARYEVLGGRTIAEFEAETGEDHKAHLYREDIVGLAQPEAEFIAHARADVDWLLTQNGELRDALVACYDAMVHRPVDSELFRTAIEVAAEALGAEGDDA